MRVVNSIKRLVMAGRKTQRDLGVSFFRAMWIQLDMRYCKRHKKMFQSEYDLFQFYCLNSIGRKAYVLGHDLMIDSHAYNAREMWPILDNKLSFNKTFHSFLGRAYMQLDSESSFDDFLSFAKQYPVVFVKPLSAHGGRGIRKEDVSTEEAARQLFAEATAGVCLIEEPLDQAEELARLNPSSINTLRVITMIDRNGEIHIPFANIRIGRANSFVDNFSTGGVTASIDIETGIVDSRLYDKKGNTYTLHPDTGEPVVGFQVPEWEQVLATIKQAAAVVPSLRYVGWDVVVRKDRRISLIEGNRAAGARMLQLVHACGLKKVYDQFLN